MLLRNRLAASTPRATPVFNRPGPWCAAAVAALSLVVAAPALAATVLALELADLVREADHIVTGRAVSEDVHRDAWGRIVTDVTIEVERTLKGPSDSGSRLVLRQLGGVIGQIAMAVPGEARVPVGSEQVLFLRDKNEVCQAVGMSQGALRVTEEDGVAMVQPGGRGLNLVEPSGGHLVPGAAAILHPIPLDTFLSQVDAMLRSQQGADPGATP